MIANWMNIDKSDYCKVQIIAGKREITELKKGPRWKIATKAKY